MNPKIEALDGELEAIRSEIVELGAVEEPTEEQVTRSEALLADWDAKKAERDALVERHNKIEAVRTAALNPANVEAGFHVPQVISKRDAFENLDGLSRESKSGLRARALNAIEDWSGISDDAKEAATVKAQRSASIAEYMLKTGSPAYRSAFEKYLEHPTMFQAMLTGEEAAAMRTAASTTASNGGYMIPFLLDPSVIITNSGSTNPFRQISRVETGTSNKWNGVTSAGITAEWKTEGSAASDATPTFSQPSITAKQGVAWVFGSYEIFEDTNLAAELPRLIMDAKDNLEATAFATGSGPNGVVTQVTAVTASRVSPTTGGAFSAASEVYKVINAVPARHRAKSSWVANYATLNAIRAFDVYGGSAFWADMNPATPPNLLGLPVYESSAMVSTITTGTNILLAGNFENFLIYDRVGISIEFIQNVVDSNGVPTGQRGYVAHWRTGSDCLNTDAFRILKL